MEKFCTRLGSLLNPYDLTPINGLGSCCLSQGFYTIFRLLMTALSITNLTYISCLIPSRALLQFTIWGLLISVFCSLFLLLQNLIIYCAPNSQIWKISNFIFNLTLIYQLFIFGVYWCGIFPYSMINSWGQSTPVEYSLYVTQHLVPIVLLTIDFFVNPIVLWNFIHIPFYFGLLAVYITVNCAYTLQKEDVYYNINFRNGLTYGFLAGCIGAILLCHLIIRLFSKCCKEGRIVWMVEEIKKRNIQQNSNKIVGMSNPSVPIVFGNSMHMIQDVVHYPQMPTPIPIETIKLYFKQNTFQ